VELALPFVLEGQLENFSPFLKNTTTEVCVPHLYGPVVEHTVPVVPLADTVL
jgi:hypothetical protein